MEEMTYVRGKNDLNRHIRYGNSEQLNFLKWSKFNFSSQYCQTDRWSSGQYCRDVTPNSWNLHWKKSSNQSSKRIMVLIIVWLAYFTHLYFSELESEVEMVRLDVVQKRCIGNPAEVDSLNSQLSIISRQVSDLKSKSMWN